MEACVPACPAAWSDELYMGAQAKNFWPGQIALKGESTTHSSPRPCSSRDESYKVRTMLQMDPHLMNPHLLEKLMLQQASKTDCEGSMAARESLMWSGDVNVEVPMSHEKMLNQVQDREVLSTISPRERDSVLSKCRKVILPRNSPTVDLAGCKRAAPSGPDLKIYHDSPSSAPPRVRARRGEATDQHSISERTRRTKITERMRALHRLIPDATKTIKASMLDEVIQYISTLQTRLEMECLQKLDSRGEPLTPCATSTTEEGWKRGCNRMYMNRMIERVLDPLEDKLAEAERQVVNRLSHHSHDLSLVTSYLGSLGLSLVPISQVSFISSATSPASSSTIPSSTDPLPLSN
ncbi:hypothetical protein KP509_30G050100 [Ceratopteris richardii]|uniref:BHLH domain-containing protein n=1 Tax=Ceratopteris richardii TaxID=49495 RepID=A0A8T2R3B5_CERRI|nr:hypothetical protein KP509_30G050100 [Ceratopteris richardii]